MHYLNATKKMSLFLAFLFLSLTFSAQETALEEQDAPIAEVGSGVDIKAGETLFKNLCASCHNRNMKDKLTGPALGGTEARWSSYPKEDLYRWIRNSSAMIAEGHPRATELWNDWKPTVMTAFPNLSDNDIESMLLYINGVYEGTYGAAASAGPVSTIQTSGTPSNNWLYYMIFAVLAVLALVLARVVANLQYLTQVKEGLDPERKTLFQVLTSKGLIAFLLFSLVLIGGYTTVNNAIALNRQQGYAPQQPIKFSHITHAGINKIDCQFCHDGARRSKHSVIPAANTCMNCHAAIKVGSTYGTGELTKIYASIGYDPSTDQYLENYDDYSEEQIKDIYTKWMANVYVEQKGELDKKGERLVATQWDELKSSLTSETKTKIQGPIEWVRIHNSPDHVYFNHAQHVSVGQIECQTCHGKVEEMEVVKQYSTLSMGWCVNCHRQSEVKFNDNLYYESYTKYHEEIKQGTRDKVTVEDIGGLECQKCHY
jgi:mono/diheme cytochrome c family protein